MALIEWNDGLSVKVEELDQQHQKLIAMINDLDDAIKGEHGYDVALRIIVRMKDYSEFHFRSEEMYFEQCNYPGTEAHVEEHQAFITKVESFENDFINGSLTLKKDVLSFLQEWLIKHILNTDFAYSSFLNEHGIK